MQGEVNPPHAITAHAINAKANGNGREMIRLSTGQQAPPQRMGAGDERRGGLRWIAALPQGPRRQIDHVGAARDTLGNLRCRGHHLRRQRLECVQPGRLGGCGQG